MTEGQAFMLMIGVVVVMMAIFHSVVDMLFDAAVAIIKKLLSVIVDAAIVAYEICEHYAPILGHAVFYAIAAIVYYTWLAMRWLIAEAIIRLSGGKYQRID